MIWQRIDLEVGALSGVVIEALEFAMDEAIKSASGVAKSGDTVLLSPMCASFDAFSNYEERGKNRSRERDSGRVRILKRTISTSEALPKSRNGNKAKVYQSL